MLGICRPDARPPLTVTWCGRSLLAARCCLALVLIHSENAEGTCFLRKIYLRPFTSPRKTNSNDLNCRKIISLHLTLSHFISQGAQVPYIPRTHTPQKMRYYPLILILSPSFPVATDGWGGAAQLAHAAACPCSACVSSTAGSID
jgi:hypothetical protein